MKRTIIITSLLTACLMGVSAQETTPLDNVFNQLSEIVPGIVYTVKGNYGAGQTTVTMHCTIAADAFCSEDVCGEGLDSLSSSNDYWQNVNERNQKQYDRLLAIIRHGLDSISALPSTEESYHFESHHQGTDTIQYAVCLHSGPQTVRMNDTKAGYFYSDTPGSETASFDLITRPKHCGKHVIGWGSLQYHRTTAVPNGQSVAADWQQYLQTVMPTLNQHGITQHKVRWVLDAPTAAEAKRNPTHAFMSHIYGTDGSLIDEGETTGTLYLIPADQLAFAQSVLSDVQAATEAYFDAHPDQQHSYVYGNKFQSADDTFRLNQMLEASNSFDLTEPSRHFVFTGTSPFGYYIMLLDTKNSMYIPTEWPILKSIVKGKKTYHKGMKP